MQCLSKHEAYELYRKHKLKLTRKTEPKNQQEKQARNPSLGANNDQEITAGFKQSSANQ